MTRFQLVFRRNGEVTRSEFYASSFENPPHLDGRLVVDGETYPIRGDEWLRQTRGHRRRAEVRLHARRRGSRIVILSGSTVRSENVQLLAAMLQGDELATKLERALTNNNTIVALSIADRERIVAVVADGPAGFAELRRMLVTQLDKHHEREAQVRQLKRDRERVRRERESPR